MDVLQRVASGLNGIEKIAEHRRVDVGRLAPPGDEFGAGRIEQVRHAHEFLCEFPAFGWIGEVDG